MSLDPAARYDDNLLLRVPLGLWLAMLFQVRHGLLLGITFMPTTGQEIIALRGLVEPQFLLADLLAAPVLLAALRRHPRCPRWLRAVWRRGRALMSLAAALYLGLLAHSVLDTGGPLERAIGDGVVLSVLATLALLAYVWRSRLVGAVFADPPGEAR